MVTRQDVHRRLLTAVIYGQYVYCLVDLATDLGLNWSNEGERRNLYRLVLEVGVIEHQSGRRLLSVIGVSRNTQRPGDTFETVRQQMGLGTGQNAESFYQSELQAVRNYWKL